MPVFQTANLKAYMIFKKATRMFLSGGDSSLLPCTAIMSPNVIIKRPEQKDNALYIVQPTIHSTLVMYDSRVPLPRYI